MTGESAIVKTLVNVEPEPVSWLWRGRIARGKLTLLAGDPGTGKSSLTIDVAARVSKGLPWPDGGEADKGQVVFICHEDGLADTVRPRVDRQLGDPRAIHAIEGIRTGDKGSRPFSLIDVDVLERVLLDFRPSLVVIDPITAYLGRTDSFKDAEVRRLLSPIVQLIARRDVALLAVGHLSKNDQRSVLHRPGGSIGFVASARVVLGVADHPHERDRRVLACIKTNLSKPPAPLAYRVGDEGLRWHGELPQLDVSELFSQRSPGRRGATNHALDLLRERLEHRAVPASEIQQAALECGISRSTLDRAKHQLGVISELRGFGGNGAWVWRLPQSGPAEVEPPASHDRDPDTIVAASAN